MTCVLCNKEMNLLEDFGEEKIFRCDECEFESLEKNGNMVKWNRYGHISKNGGLKNDQAE